MAYKVKKVRRSRTARPKGIKKDRFKLLSFKGDKVFKSYSSNVKTIQKRAKTARSKGLKTVAFALNGRSNRYTVAKY